MQTSHFEEAYNQYILNSTDARNKEQHGSSQTSTFDSASHFDGITVGAPSFFPSENPHDVTRSQSNISQPSSSNMDPPIYSSTQFQSQIPMSPQYLETQMQLEVLRETRRIRELELRIESERRQANEELRKQKEAELALENLRMFGSSGSSSNAPDGMPDISLPSQSPHLFAAPSSSLPGQAPIDPFTAWFQSAMDTSIETTFPSLLTPEASTLPTVSHPSATSTSSAPTDSNEASPAADPPSPPSLPTSAQTSNPRTTTKKASTIVTEEFEAQCSRCSKAIAKLILRGERTEMDAPFRTEYQCSDCVPVFPASSSRKRTNQFEDTTLPTVCGVCSKIKGQGGFVSIDRDPLLFSVEIVCLSCSEKYKRCSNCGGGNLRTGVGKWRCKELFEGSRKTCSLSHARLGAKEMELAVWEFPREGEGRPEFSAVLAGCENLWKEHLLAKLAIPEVLEHSTALQSWQDIQEKILMHGTIVKDVLKAQPMTPEHHIYVALTWSRTRSRKDKLKPNWSRTSEERTSEDWISPNTRRSNVFYPQNSVLCGAWFCEWNIRERTVLIGTVTPFDHGEVEDRSMLSLTTVLSRILEDLQAHNADCTNPADEWLSPEHLWSGIKANPYPLRARLIELLQRRIGFLTVDEYIAQHPETQRSMFSANSGNIAKATNERRSVDGHDTMDVLVRHLGSGISIQGLRKVVERELSKKPRSGDV